MKAGQLAETAVAIALAAVLSLVKIKLPHLIYGGSVSLHAVPVVIVALRHGVRAGVLAGGAYGIVNFLMTPYFVHPVQLLLDYPVAFGTLGLAGIMRGHRARWVVMLAVAGAGLIRLGVHVLSGVVYFAELAPPGAPVWHYSLTYNSSYMIPEILLSSFGAGILMRRLSPTDTIAPRHLPEENE